MTTPPSHQIHRLLQSEIERHQSLIEKNWEYFPRVLKRTLEEKHRDPADLFEKMKSQFDSLEKKTGTIKIIIEKLEARKSKVYHVIPDEDIYNFVRSLNLPHFDLKEWFRFYNAHKSKNSAEEKKMTEHEIQKSSANELAQYIFRGVVTVREKIIPTLYKQAEFIEVDEKIIEPFMGLIGDRNFTYILKRARNQGISKAIANARFEASDNILYNLNQDHRFKRSRKGYMRPHLTCSPCVTGIHEYRDIFQIVFYEFYTQMYDMAYVVTYNECLKVIAPILEYR